MRHMGRSRLISKHMLSPLALDVHLNTMSLALRKSGLANAKSANVATLKTASWESTLESLEEVLPSYSASCPYVSLT